MRGISKMDLCEDVALITYNNMLADLSVISDIFDHFSNAGINIDMISQSMPSGRQVDLSFTCFGRDLVKALTITRDLATKYPQVKPMVISGNCKLQLFGAEMREMHGVFAKALAALRDIPLELRLVTTSEVDISLLLDSAHIQQAMEALGTAFDI